MSAANPEKNRYNLLIQLGAAIRKFPNVSLEECLSAGQIESKRWLVETLEALNAPLGSIFVVGGWWGVLPAMLFEAKLDLQTIRSFDIDPACAPIADTLNRRYVMDGWKFKAATEDMLHIDYARHTYRTKKADGSEVELMESPDTIINTSCEHIVRFSEWWERIPAGKTIVLQSNNYSDHPEHKNCSESLDQFIRTAPMKQIHFRGELKLSDYTRYMVIGRK